MHDDPTPRLVFPDTTVLINFALVDEMPLLGRLVADNGSWCGTVASESDLLMPERTVSSAREVRQL